LGEIAQVFLVISVRRCAALGVTALVLALLQLQSLPVHAGVVNAADYSAFWLWGGVKSQPVLSGAQTLYILQGQVTEQRPNNNVTVIAQGMSIARPGKSTVWLVYRAETLRWTPEVVGALVMRLKQWRLAGNHVVGLQIDFDVKTRRLQEYADFLKRLRGQLPPDCQLSITGLLDWSSNGDVAAINQLKNVVDEVAVQTYQGRKTIANYASYLPALKRLTVPFKIGLLQNGEWQAPAGLESNPLFKGYVVFLQNQAPN
jgi:hypothetical protein